MIREYIYPFKEDSPEGNLWGIKFFSMFHMVNDSHLFRTCEQLETDGWKLLGDVYYKGSEKCLLLYEGKMIVHFDHQFGSFDGSSQTNSDLSKPQHDNPLLFSIPHYWVHESHMPKLIKDGRAALLAFREITNTTNVRTAIFSILPALPRGDTLHTVVLNRKYTHESTHFSSCTSSFIFDYIARQELGDTHMKPFNLKQLPVLPTNQHGVTSEVDNRNLVGDWMFPRALELTYTAWDLEPFVNDCGYDGPPLDGMRSGVSCCAVSWMRLISTCMASSTMTWTTSLRRSLQ